MWPLHREWQNLANNHQYLVVKAPVEHGKTQNWSVMRPAWLLGKNLNHSIAIVSNSIDHPIRCLRNIRETIEHNERYHEVFPWVKLEQNTQTEITVRRPRSKKRDPSLIAFGIGGSIIGRRWTGVILDDILDFDSTWTHEGRLKTRKILESTVLNRVLANGFVHAIGTPWNIEDAMKWLGDLPGYHKVRYDALDMLWPEKYTDPETGEVFGFPKERLNDIRGRMTKLEFDRQFRCIASSSSFETFSPTDLDECLRMGQGLKLGRQAPPDACVVSGVDLAIKKKDSADMTVIFTGTVIEGVKEILDIQSGHWELPEICRQVIECVRKYGSQHFGCFKP
jgi:hypothetical protein